LLKLAVALQKQINTELPFSMARDPLRVRGLETLIAELEVRPLLQSSLDFEVVAKTLESQKNWNEAFVAWNEALTTQKDINRLYHGRSIENQPRQRELERIIETYAGLELYEQSQREAEKAQLAEAKNDNETARKAYKKASETQRRLNELHAGSRFASPVKFRQFTELAFNAQARPAFLPLNKKIEKLKKALQTRDKASAKEQIRGLSDAIEEFLSDFPKNTLLRRENGSRIRYIEAMMPHIENIWKRVDVETTFLDEKAGTRIFKLPVSYEFYEILAGRPAQKYEDKEHNSFAEVSASEAMRFTTRLSYVLARAARLPSSQELSLYAVSAADKIQKHEWARKEGNQPLILYKEKDVSGKWLFSPKFSARNDNKKNAVFHFVIENE